MRVGIYIRVSTNDQSSELQLRELQAFAKARGWRDVEVFSDQATGTTSRRPGLNDAIKAARQRRIDVLLIWRLDRLFRSLRHMVGLLHELEDLGVTFISVRDQIDMTTATGRLMTHILAAFAEFEASIIKERVQAGLENAKAKGVKLGRPRKIDSALVWAMRREGKSLLQIARKVGASKSGVHKTLAAMPDTKGIESAE